MPISPYPTLNARSRGWLRFLWDKATTPDDWSSAGTPHDWWDRASTEPMCAFTRFDLSESTYALIMMADQTPAWREVYGRISEELCARFTTHWAAVDWLTQIGPDPRRKDYPEAWLKSLIPEHVAGDYDVPGWTANGIEPWGLQPDPIGAVGNLFFRGFFNLVLSPHRYISGDDKWERPFSVTGYNDRLYEWSHHGIAEYLSSQWSERPEGPHCENTKIWPYCLSTAGLGLQLYDRLHGKRTHRVYENWLDYCRANYMSVSDSGELDWFTLYYDPILEHHHTRGPASGIGVSLYMLPQDRAFATYLYEAAVTALGWNDPAKPVTRLPDPRTMLIALNMARELGDHTTAARLGVVAEREFEPLFFGAEQDRFGWWFDLGEAWPRGQLSALMMMTDVGDAGAWSRAFSQPNLGKFAEPTVEGVDFPHLGIAQACNDARHGVLHVRTYAATPSRRGTATSWRVRGLPGADEVVVLCDGQPFDRFDAAADGTIVLHSTVDDLSFQIHGGVVDPSTCTHETGTQAPQAGNLARPASVSAPPSRALMPSAVSCPCCPGF